jgi:hypothetical protein
MDIKLEQFLQKSGFTNTHASKKVYFGFSSNNTADGGKFFHFTNIRTSPHRDIQ